MIYRRIGLLRDPAPARTRLHGCPFLHVSLAERPLVGVPFMLPFEGLHNAVVLEPWYERKTPTRRQKHAVRAQPMTFCYAWSSDAPPLAADMFRQPSTMPLAYVRHVLDELSPGVYRMQPMGKTTTHSTDVVGPKTPSRSYLGIDCWLALVAAHISLVTSAPSARSCKSSPIIGLYEQAAQILFGCTLRWPAAKRLMENVGYVRYDNRRPGVAPNFMNVWAKRDDAISVKIEQRYVFGSCIVQWPDGRAHEGPPWMPHILTDIEQQMAYQIWRLGLGESFGADGIASDVRALQRHVEMARDRLPTTRDSLFAPFHLSNNHQKTR